MGYIGAANTFEKPDWGSYYRPMQPAKNAKGALRVVLFGSTLGGMWVLEALKKLKLQYGDDKIKLVGLATDDARVPHARISLKKRIWHYYTPDVRMKLVDGIIERALDESMEVFTGNIKSDFFAQLLDQWKPDVIIMACFGQIVPASIFSYPALGMYNFHPSDLKNDIGAGPRPFEDTIAHAMSHTRVSLMEVTEIVDHGPMVAQSPSICITGHKGEFFDDLLITEEKVTSIFPYMADVLITQLLQLQVTSLESDKLKIDMEREIQYSVQELLLETLSGKHGEHYPFPDLQILNHFYSLPQDQQA